MFYLMFVPVSIMLLLELRYLIRLRTHDRVLFPICEARGDLVRRLMIADAAGTLKQDDYVYARWLLGGMDRIVSLYRDHRTHFFNLRAYLRFVRQYTNSARDLIAVPRTDNAELRAIEQRFNRAMLRGFLAYTPWLKSELAATIVIAISTMHLE
jgi:hypothetical protein